jgi:hypothetical protein
MENPSTVVLSLLALLIPLAGPALAAFFLPASLLRESGGRRPVAVAGVLSGPALATAAVLIAVWLPGFAGQCGGWLGETEPCGFWQFAAEAVYWSTLTLALPAVAGLVAGLMVLGCRLWWARRARG